MYPQKIDGILYPEHHLCLLVGKADLPEGTVNRTTTLRRCVHPDALRDVRGELRRAYALRDNLMDAALAELSRASVHHFELERIYSAAMDFPAKEAFTEKFCERVLGEG